MRTGCGKPGANRIQAAQNRVIPGPRPDRACAQAARSRTLRRRPPREAEQVSHPLARRLRQASMSAAHVARCSSAVLFNGLSWKIAAPRCSSSGPKRNRRYRCFDPANIVAMLTRHRAQQNRERLVAGSRWHERGHTFAGTTGTPLDDRNVGREFYALLKAHSRPRLRPHDRRHS